MQTCRTILPFFLKGEIYEQKTIREAEATKVVENTFRDINIAYVNELAKSFDHMGIDLVSVLRVRANKPFGFLAHFPGCGVGGHCIPVDPITLSVKQRKKWYRTFLPTTSTRN